MAAHRSKKRKRIPSDANWCLHHASSLSLRSFVRNFELYERQYNQAHYRTILEKYFEHDAKASLLAELKQWNLSMNSTVFWKEQSRSKMISDTHASCSAPWTKSLWKKHFTLAAATTLLLLPPPPPMQALFRMKPTGKISTRTAPEATSMQPIQSAIH